MKSLITTVSLSLLIIVLFSSSIVRTTLDGLYLNFRNTTTSKIGQVYYSGDSLYAKVHDSTFLLTSRLQMGSMYLNNIDTTHCTTANTYYKVYSLGGFIDGDGNGFIIDGNGKITFVGQKGTNSVVMGVSDLTADKTTLITYVLRKNGVSADHAETPCDINNPGKSKSVSITRMIPHLKTGDYFEVWCKSDNANTTVTHNTLMLSFACDR